MSRYLQMYFKESDKINDFSFYKEVEVNGELHIFTFDYTKADILKILCSFDKEIQETIRETFIKIDFKNGDINHFIEYILNRYCEDLIKNEVGKNELETI